MSTPKLEQYPGYYPAGSKPFWSRTKVGFVAGVAGLLVGIVGGGYEAEPAAAPEPEPEPEPAPAVAGGAAGTLRVQTRPWSKVFVDGRMVGNTPLMGVEISAGRHTLTFVNDDFGIRKSVKVDVQPGQVVTQVLTLDE